MRHQYWTLFIGLLSAFLIPSHPKSIQIHAITNNAGALILKKGEGRIVTGYDRLLHVIDFTQFEISLSIMENMISQLANSSSSFSDIINIKLREIKFILNSIHTKTYRSKRSIDFLGKAVKFVTGNLDADDLTFINTNLNELRRTGNTLIHQNNRQIKINSKFENRLNLINNAIKNQENVLRQIINNSDFATIENQKILIIFQLDTFLNTLKSIEYSIMLAKINIISKLILTPKEIEIIAQEIKDQGLQIHDLDEASDYLTTTVFYKEAALIISVNIPHLHHTTYQKVIMEPLPLLNHTIKLVHKTVFINQHEIFAITSNCRENSQVTLCERSQLVEISDDPCEAPLLREQHGQCHLSEKPPTTETRMISPGTLLIITVHQDVTINSTCGVNNKTLTGIHLVTFHNCSLYVRNQLYENFELRFYQPTILPIQPIKIKAFEIDRHINISELHELNIQNRQHLNTVRFKHLVGFASLGTVIIFIIAVIGFGIFKYHQIIKSSSGHCSGRAILIGGAVKHENTTSSINTNIAAPVHSTHGSTEPAKSAVSKVATSKWSVIGNHAAQDSHTGSLDNVSTGGPSLLGTRSAVLGTQLGQLGL